MPHRSEEVQDIIDRMPTGWCGWVVTIVASLIVVLLTLSCIIRYPETVDGQVSITANTAPVRLVSVTNGRLHLLLSRETQVRQGDVLAYVESGTNYQHYLALKSFLVQEDIKKLPPQQLELGELSSTYNTFLFSLQHYLRISHSPRYATVRKSLQAQIEADQKVAAQLARSREYREKMNKNLAREMHRDSMLIGDGFVSQSEMEANANNYYAQADAAVNVQANRYAKQADIRRSQTEIARNEQEEAEAIEEARSDMEAKRNVLLGEMRLWEEKYLFRAPMSGQLDYLGFWHENTTITAGTEVFSILPSKNHVIGEAHISAMGAGKVHVGQVVNVKLQDFPYDEFGQLKGRVMAISRLTNKTQVEKQVSETYLVEILFPEGLVTNFGQRLPLNFESKGTAEIITQPKRLIQRLFDNLKAKTEK